MFNVGIISSGRKNGLVRLSSAELFHNSDSYEGGAQVMFLSDGGLVRTGDSWTSTVQAGEWYASHPKPGIAANYQIRKTHQAGQMSIMWNSNFDFYHDTWTDILNSPSRGSRVMWTYNTYGRVLVEIREKASQKVVASAQYWVGSQYAP